MSGRHVLKGRVLTALGVLVLTPDSLLVRLISTDQWTLLFWRGLLSALALLLYTTVTSRGRPFAKLMAVGWSGLVVAAAFTVSVVCFVTAIHHTSVAHTLIIIAASPFVTALLGWLILGESTRLGTLITMTVASLGIVLVVSDDPATGSLLGDLAAAGTALSVAVAFVTLRHGKGTDMVPSLIISGLATAVVAVPLATPLAISRPDALGLAVLGLVVVPVSFALVTVGPRYLPAAEVNLFMLIETALGPVWVWVVVGDRPSLPAVVGGTVVLAALAVESALALRLSRAQGLSVG